MGQLSLLKNFLGQITHLVVAALGLLAVVYQRVWGFLRRRVPFVEALIKRYRRHPVTFSIDLAILILITYLALGSYGFWLIYRQKAETRLAETLSQIYPLPAARVNHSLIWSSQFLVRLRFLNTFNERAPQGVAKPPTDQELRQRVLEGLIEDKIIQLEARKRRLTTSKAELEAALAKQGDPQEIKQRINELYGMSLTNFKAIVAEQVLKEKVKTAVLARVKIRHVLTSTLPAAQEAKKGLEDGRRFEEVAKEFSQDSRTKDAGGDLGYWYRGELASQISPAFEQAVFSLSVNQVTEPIGTQFGFHVVQLIERSGDNQQTYDEWLKERLTKYKIKRYLPI